jgi:hypothetical protein
MTLEPPQYWDSDESKQPKGRTDLEEFTIKCLFHSMLCFWFALVEMKGSIAKLAPDVLDMWHSIFQQSITYPPSEGHPLYAMLQELKKQV